MSVNRPPDPKDYDTVHPIPLAIICGFIGLVLAFPVMMFGTGRMGLEERNAFHSWVIFWFPVGGFLGGLTVGGLMFLSALSGYGAAQARHQRDLDNQEREKALRLERSKSLYASAYAEYLPKWQAWREKMKTYEAELASYQAWRAKFVAVWEAYHERAKQAAKLFELIHSNVQMRGRVELELSDAAHLQALFREAIAEVGKANPDLGMLRMIGPIVSAETPPGTGGAYNPLTSKEMEKYSLQVFPVVEGGPVNHRQVFPVISHNLPGLAYLFDDERVAAVVDLLPEVPGVPAPGAEHRKEPEKPAFPNGPGNIIFSAQDAFGYYAPVPPERVTWS